MNVAVNPYNKGTQMTPSRATGGLTIYVAHQPGAVEETLHMAAVAADTGDWASFVAVMGGPTASRKEHTLKTVHAWSDKEGRHGEPAGEKIIGGEDGNALVVTRCHEWTIEKNKGPLGPLEFCQ